MKYLKLILLLSVFSLLSSGCAIYHHYGPYYGKVVDADTKQPLEGAAVLAVYYTQSYGPGGSVSHFLDSQEVVTDKKGEFNVPPMTALTFRSFQSFETYAWFTIFKPGYGCYPNYKKVKLLRPNGTLPIDQYVTIELPNVNNESKENRLRNAACLPSPSVPENKFKKLQELLQVEYKTIGY
jgi:hypothetical protein